MVLKTKTSLPPNSRTRPEDRRRNRPPEVVWAAGVSAPPAVSVVLIVPSPSSRSRHAAPARDRAPVRARPLAQLLDPDPLVGRVRPAKIARPERRARHARQARQERAVVRGVDSLQPALEAELLRDRAGGRHDVLARRDL